MNIQGGRSGSTKHKHLKPRHNRGLRFFRSRSIPTHIGHFEPVPTLTDELKPEAELLLDTCQ